MTESTGDDSGGVAAALTKLGRGASIDRALGKERERPTPPGVKRRSTARQPAVVPADTSEDHDDHEHESDEEELEHDDDGVIEHIDEQVHQEAPSKPKRTPAAKSAPEGDFAGSEPPDMPESRRSLAWLNKRYGLGTDNGAEWRVFRMSPENARDAAGVVFKSSGFLGKSTEAIDEEWLRVNYGGGRLSCRLNLPDESGSLRQRTAVTIDIAGSPLRRPGTEGDATVLTGGIQQVGGPAAPPMIAQPEAPSVVTKAMDVLGQTVERTEARAQELRDGQREAINEQTGLVKAMADERVRDVQAAKERELENMRAHYQGLLEERDERIKGKEREIEGLRSQIATLSARDPIQDVSRLKTAGLLGDGGAGHQELMKTMQQSHASEMSRMRDSHRDEMAALRTSAESERSSLREVHNRELASLKESHQRQLAMNDESWKSRLDRADAATENERKNARELSDRHRQERQDIEDRYKARLDDAKSVSEATATSRYDTMVTQKDLRIESLKEENERLKGDLATERAKNVESGDALTQLHRAKGMIETMKGMVGGGESAAPPPSTTERLLELANSPVGAMLANVLMVGMQPPPAAAPAPTVQQRPVVQQPAVQRAPLAAPPGFAPLPSPLPDMDDVLEAQQEREVAHERAQRPVPQAQPAAPQQPAAQQQPQPQQGNVQAAQMMQHFVNELEVAISDGDTPEEFAEEVKRQVPEQMLRSLLAQVSATDLQQMIDANHPTSQIASKAGHDFVAKVFKLLGGHG